MPMEETRVCLRCKRELMASEFRHRYSAAGELKLRTYCRYCESLLAKKRNDARGGLRWEPVLSLDKLAKLCEQRRLERLASKDYNY